jgi:hypothetical protein
MMLGRQKCISCARLSPETNGDSTLTTSYGWRIRKGTDEAGNTVIEWRCPPCWQRFKAQQGGGTPSGGPPSSGKA